MSILNRPYFRDEEAAHAFLETILWPAGSVCPKGSKMIEHAADQGTRERARVMI